MITPEQKEILLFHLGELKPLRIGIFGSYSRNENKKGSDLDVLIHLDYTKNISLLTLVKVQDEASDALGIKVDLVTERSLSPFIRPYVEKDVKWVYFKMS